MLPVDDYPVRPKAYVIVRRHGRDHVAAMMPYPVFHPEDAKCSGDEAFWTELENVRGVQLAYMKQKCAQCPLATACREWAIAHERNYLWGGLGPDERSAIRRERDQVIVEPSAAHFYGLGVDWLAPFTYGHNREGI
jgi:hypothetical protein